MPAAPLVHIDYVRVSEAIRSVLGRSVDAGAYVEAEYSGRAAVEAGMTTGDLPTDTSRLGGALPRHAGIDWA